MKRTKRKKTLSRTRTLLIAIFIVVVAWGIYSLYTTSSPPTTLTSSSSELSPSDFLIMSESQICGTNTQTGRIAVDVGADLENRQGTPFHFVSATIVLLNFTLSNGTVVAVNQQVTDNKATYDTQHLISIAFRLPSLPPNTSVTKVEFTITAHVEEVPAPITLPLSEPIHQCST